jgi:hypothetical protein
MASSEASSPAGAGAAPDAAGAAPDAAGAAALLDALLPAGAPADRVLVHALLRLAQAELLALDLASTTVAAEGGSLVVCCALAGPTPSVSLSSMRALQAYSPARVGEVRAAMRGGRMSLVVDVRDAAARAGTAELERALADVCLL